MAGVMVLPWRFWRRCIRPRFLRQRWRVKFPIRDTGPRGLTVMAVIPPDELRLREPCCLFLVMNARSMPEAIGLARKAAIVENGNSPSRMESKAVNMNTVRVEAFYG